MKATKMIERDQRHENITKKFLTCQIYYKNYLGTPVDLLTMGFLCTCRSSCANSFKYFFIFVKFNVISRRLRKIHLCIQHCHFCKYTCIHSIYKAPQLSL